MSINDILMDEQLTLMQHAAAVDTGEIRGHRRKLSLFAAILTDHPYPHRPFVPSNCAERALPGLAAWENEGGQVARISPATKDTAHNPTKNPAKLALPTS